jgi:ABC-type thiamine transport system ATPase subunit
VVTGASRLEREGLDNEILAGEVDVEWAWSHRREIAAARPTLRGSRRDREATLVAALSDRLDALATTARLRPPVLLDEPFGPVDDTELRELISLVLHTTEDLQLVLLPEGVRIAEWARLEQLGGTI